jgi:hypothetical protein
LDGSLLIGIAIAVDFLSGCSLAISKDPQSVAIGLLGLGIAGMIYLAGVIRWSVSGAYFIQMDRIHKRINRVIELLEKLVEQDRPKN